MYDDEDDEWDADSADDSDESETVTCPYCRRAVYEDAEQCPHCGQYISQEDAPAAGKPLWFAIAFLLAAGVALSWILW